MRILFLIRSLDAGGAERQLVCLANGLASRGHEVGVAVFYGGGTFESSLRNDIRFFDLKKSGRWDVFSFCRRLLSCVSGFTPDVFYTYLGTSNLLSSLVKLFHPSLPCVWGVRASSMDMSKYGWVAQIDDRLQTVLCRVAAKMISNSSAGAIAMQERGVDPDRLAVIPNGIDTDMFLPDRSRGVELRRQWGFSEDELVVGIIARLDVMKDHETFLSAAQFASKAESALRFVVVGDGPSDVRTRLVRLAEKLKLHDSVVWAGRVDDMPAVYNAINVCCLSSAFGEGFPNVLGEAMSSGVPCVATKVGDSNVVIGDERFVVPPENPEALAQAMLRLVKVIQAGERLALRERILDNFSLEQLFDATESLLKELAP